MVHTEQRVNACVAWQIVEEVKDKNMGLVEWMLCEAIRPIRQDYAS